MRTKVVLSLPGDATAFDDDYVNCEQEQKIRPCTFQNDGQTLIDRMSTETRQPKMC